MLTKSKALKRRRDERLRIALAGNPNSGKTTMFNALTGRNERVGNWAGVTVDKKAHSIKKRFSGDAEILAVDLPGAYSISPFTAEESVTSEYIKNEKPDAIINIVDGTSLSRSLFFTTQLLELGIPTVIALNKSDVNKKRETDIDTKRLSELLGCPVVETVSTSKRGLAEIVSIALGRIGKEQTAPYSDSKPITDKASAFAADERRYAFVNKIIADVEKKKYKIAGYTVQDKIDAVITNRWVGLPIFAFVMFLVFGISQAWLGPLIAELFSGALNLFKDTLAEALMNDTGELGIWASILVDGIIGGVIAVVGFLPLVMIMYFLIALLEDCGYMARATVVLDPIFKKVGLSGKSVIPFIIGTGCSVPGIMACRTIKDERERRATAMLAPFMPCGAKLPLISLFAGAFFGKSAWVGTLMYFMGIFIILIGAFLINVITGYNRKKSYFIMELPEYRLPSLKRASLSMLSRGWSFIVKAGTVILVCNFIIHIMQTFTWRFEVADATNSILHDVATPFAYALAPIIGIVAWQFAAAAITGFIAKENVVGTLAVCFGISNLINTESLEIVGSANEVALVFGITRAAALAFLMFNLFSPPCFAAIGAMRGEIKDKKWFWAGIGLQLSVGYSIGFLVNFFATVLSEKKFSAFWIPTVGFTVIIVIATVFTLIAISARHSADAANDKGSVTLL